MGSTELPRPPLPLDPESAVNDPSSRAVTNPTPPDRQPTMNHPVVVDQTSPSSISWPTISALSFRRFNWILMTVQILIGFVTWYFLPTRDQLLVTQPDTRRRLDFQISLVVTAFTQGARVATRWRVIDDGVEFLWELATSLLWVFTGPFLAVSLYSSLL